MGQRVGWSPAGDRWRFQDPDRGRMVVVWVRARRGHRGPLRPERVGSTRQRPVDETVMGAGAQAPARSRRRREAKRGQRPDRPTHPVHDTESVSRCVRPAVRWSHPPFSPFLASAGFWPGGHLRGTPPVRRRVPRGGCTRPGCWWPGTRWPTVVAVPSVRRFRPGHRHAVTGSSRNPFPRRKVAPVMPGDVAELVAAAKAGDREAFDELAQSDVRRHVHVGVPVDRRRGGCARRGAGSVSAGLSWAEAVPGRRPVLDLDVPHHRRTARPRSSASATSTVTTSSTTT